MPDRVAVCIASFRRPLGLERLLRALSGLVFSKVPMPELEVVVVDNDPEGSAAPVCDAVRPGLRWPLRYEREPRRGIAQARNRALACTLDSADFIAFIDDDETPSPAWLDELLHVQKTYWADAVAGPYLARFEEPAPQWVVKGRFFERPRPCTGTRLRDCATANVLLRTETVRKMERLFDERLGLVGGEDTEFFVHLTHTGFSLVWADNAVVHDWIPATRLRARWILQREYRSAITWSQCERRIRPSAGARMLRASKGLIRILQGVLLLPLSFRGRHALVRALHHIARGAGHLVGLTGVHYEEYRVIHGS